MYHNWLDHRHVLLIFLILVLFWLSDTGQIWGFRAFPGECMEGIAWHDDIIKWKHFCVTGPLCGEFTRHGEFRSQRPVTRSFDVSLICTLNKREAGDLRHHPAHYDIIVMKFDMLMNPDHLHNWLDFGHGLLIFVLLVSLHEMGQTWGFSAFPG